MAEALFLVERTAQTDNNVRDAIKTVVINSDDGKTDAQIIADAVAAVNAALPADADAASNKLPDGYFDTVSTLSDLTSGPLATDQDFMTFGGDIVAEVRT